MERDAHTLERCDIVYLRPPKGARPPQHHFPPPSEGPYEVVSQPSDSSVVLKSAEACAQDLLSHCRQGGLKAEQQRAHRHLGAQAPRLPAFPELFEGLAVHASARQGRAAERERVVRKLEPNFFDCSGENRVS